MKDAFHRRVVDGDASAVNPAGEGTKAASTTSSPSRPAGERSCGSGCGRRRRRRARHSGGVRRGVPRPDRRGGRVLRRARSRGATAEERRVAAAGLRGAALEQAVLPLRDRRDWLEGDPSQPAPPAGRADGPQRRLAARLQPRHHLDAGQVGVSLVRGLGPRLPHDPVRAHRSALRQGAARCCCCASGTCTRTARSRPTSSPSAT